LVEIFTEIEKFLPKNNFSIKSIKKIVELLKNHLNYARSWNTAKIIVDYMHRSGMYAQIKIKQNFESLEKLENIRIFFSKIAEFENISKDKTIFEFIEYLNLIIDAGDNPPVYQEDKYEDAVNIMTVHAAKGLEFATVFLPYLVHGRFPSNEKSDPIELPEELIKETLPSGDVHLQEERRLFYVAMTRAKNELVISASQNYLGNKKEKKISAFVKESISKNDYLDFAKKTNLNFLKKNEGTKRKSAKTFEKMQLSPSAIETFQTCPKKFEFGYVFKIKTPPNQSLSFGDSIHNSLRDCYNLMRNQQKISHIQIKKIYQNNWQNLGYFSKKEEQKAYQLGYQSIIKIVNSDKIIPLAVEKKFDLKIDDLARISGRIDKINQSSNNVEIIDYKTGDGRKKTKSELTKNLPLAIYALYIHQQEKIYLCLIHSPTRKNQKHYHHIALCN
ncbi:MAG: ATP-dependent helicase, partial [Patescibacteria group bacterium]|nr:ATP-dependent helicase [Patescibacteria group bacterium]